ncbi:hypothetical protein AtDm6_2900 [Acetobacter tropicalis]|uniref:Uncharacterized protein n=1 Tax=Acetobacter tropicalis TaxID=104102 RepID=A0A094YKY2_9PROT|nr:hypothetical protein AtDm6_2900 [Acetobacter tropicalis]
MRCLFTEAEGCACASFTTKAGAPTRTHSYPALRPVAI